MAKQYAKVTLLEGRPFYIEVTDDSGAFLTGYEVDREGTRIHVGGGFDQRLRIIDRSVIKRNVPMTMNLHYGELEAVKEGKV